jgi:transposase InsO family protein
VRTRFICAKEEKKSTDHQQPAPISHRAESAAPRNFTADAANKKWVADITFVETREGWLYLSDVLDTYSRKIVGWAMDKQHDTTLVEMALQMALQNRHPASGADPSFGSGQRICEYSLSNLAATPFYSGKYGWKR